MIGEERELSETISVQKTIQTPSGFTRPHPLLKQRDSIRKDIVALSAQFGLTPASRLRLNVEDVQSPEDAGDPFDYE